MYFLPSIDIFFTFRGKYYSSCTHVFLENVYEKRENIIEDADAFLDVDLPRAAVMTSDVVKASSSLYLRAFLIFKYTELKSKWKMFIFISEIIFPSFSVC